MLSLRRATMADWARLYDWRNDPLTRENSLRTDPVTVAEHMRWLERILKDGSVRIYIANEMTVGHDVGMCRADIVRKKGKTDASITLGISVDARHRGRGYAAQMLQCLIGNLKDFNGVLSAQVKEGNLPSLRAFAAVGFVPSQHADGVVTLERKL